MQGSDDVEYGALERSSKLQVAMQVRLAQHMQRSLVCMEGRGGKPVEDNGLNAVENPLTVEYHNGSITPILCTKRTHPGRREELGL